MTVEPGAAGTCYVIVDARRPSSPDPLPDAWYSMAPPPRCAPCSR